MDPITAKPPGVRSRASRRDGATVASAAAAAAAHPVAGPSDPLPRPIRAEVLRINTDARHIALQVALLVPILAGLVGLCNGFRMMRLPDPRPSPAVEGMVLG